MTIEADITAWALERPGWQQDVLVALAQGDSFDRSRIEVLADEILAGTNTVPSQEAKNISARSAETDQVSLVAVNDVHGVNALVDGQELTLAPAGLTVIYGDNGSGKSGYARVIKAVVVGARHRSDILPDVFDQHAEAPSATVNYTVAGLATQVALPTDPTPELRKITFYDEHCGDEYLTRESTISYRPSALMLLDGLIAVCDEIRSELASRATANESKALNLNLPPTTEAGRFLADLRARTTDAEVDAATHLAPDASDRLATLLAEEVRLNASNARQEKDRLATLSTHARRISQDLAGMLRSFDGEATAERIRLRQVAYTAREAASVAATVSFEGEPLNGVGSETWRALWMAARNFSTTVAYQDHDFPVTADDARCVLCQQTLDAHAKTRFERFASFMTDTTERDAQMAEEAFNQVIIELRTLRVNTPDRSTAIAALVTHDAALAQECRALLTLIELRRDTVIDYLTGEATEPAPMPAVDLDARLGALADELTSRSEATDVAGYEAKLASVTKEIAELQAAVRLSEAKELLKAEAVRLRELAELRTARSAADTNAITQKSTALAREYATAHILDQFTRETDRLKLQRVTLRDLGGRKGQLNQMPGLLGAIRGTEARDVLSEGEQTALGLAGFFTEAHFDASKSAMVFDDPVTSLDHVRRDKVAQRLAQFAADRQVIVFTHDVALAGDLSIAAKRANVTLTERAVERRGSQPGVCLSVFPWKAKDFGSRVDHLRTELAKLTAQRGDMVQDEWEEKVASWAGYLSETWERCVTSEILNEVFDRGTSQVRVMKFRLFAAITPEDDQDLQNGYTATSKWARRHDKALETNYVAPEPDDLQHELERILDWQKRIRRYLK